MRNTIMLLLAIVLSVLTTHAQDLEIISFHHNGLVTWTDTTDHSNRTYRVEWSDDLMSNMWSSSWGDLTNIPYNVAGMSAAVPMFYRVVINPLTVHVATNGNDSTANGTTSQPYATIQQAIDDSADGDTILVHAGTYSGVGNRDIDFGGKSVIVRSASGPLATTIDCGDSTRAFKFSGGEDGAVIDGFTIQNARDHVTGDWFKGAVILGGAPNGGVSVVANATIQNCFIVSNRVTSGYLTTYASAIYFHPGTGTVINCVVADNSLQSGTLSGSPGPVNAQIIRGSHVINCTLADNLLTAGGVERAFNRCPSVANTIVWDNSLTATSLYSSVEYSDLELAENGVGNISTNPAFVAPALYDYSLQSGSPCVNAGTNGQVTVTEDISGNTRIAGGTVDMGAYERP